MSIVKYRDFLPRENPRKGLFGGVDFAGFDTCVEAMNDWLQRNTVEIVQVETVTLPNIHNAEEEGSTDTELHASAHTVWYQILRLWYRE